MTKFNALVIAGVMGAALGTTLRPGALEIMIVAAVLMGGMALYRRTSQRPIADGPS